MSHQAVIDLTIAGMVALAGILVSAVLQSRIDRQEQEKKNPGANRGL